ncbi:hypothetical protein ACH5RR_041846 [Cinchona calisaya]|uniref:Uncharacterized protein n=1 Tax=Cinchona calisaya TaxID=153742 RepID=A0ABD2Y0E8_9GENT
MKGTCVLLASILAASTTVALSSTPCSDQEFAHALAEKRRTKNLGRRDNKFAPRFDGLRFIETLITAHRRMTMEQINYTPHLEEGIASENLVVALYTNYSLADCDFTSISKL